MYSHDGMGTPEAAAMYAKEVGQNALGLTDHGTVSGLLDHYTACKRVGIKSVMGVEAYHQRVFNPEEKRYHLTLLAQTSEGYRNLLRMTTAANQENFYRFPIVTDGLLEKFSDGVVVLTGCTSSYISQMVIQGEQQKAFDFLVFLGQVFATRLYLEVQPIRSPGQVEVNRQMEVWEDLYGYPVALTADSHYIHQEDYSTYLISQKIRRPDQEMLVDYSLRYMAYGSELASAYGDLMLNESGLKYAMTSQQIADSCDVSLDTSYSIPRLSWVQNEKQELTKLALMGVKDKGLYSGREIFPEYKSRLRHELDLILDKGFAGYMLLCADIAAWCRSMNIYCQARGSACGSLWAYLTGISPVDPIKYNTSFDRFISPDRVDYPDIDLDIEGDKKDAVVEYLLSRYHGAQIVTFGAFKTRLLANKLIEAIPFENGDAQLFKVTLEEKLGGLEAFRLSDLLKNPVLARLERKYGCVTHFAKLYGQVQYIGKHAAGVALTDCPLTDRVAVMKVHDQLVTSYDMLSLDLAKVTKVDLLGVDALSVVHKAEVDAGAAFEDRWLHDANVLDAFARGETIGIFQKERHTPRKMLKQIAKARGGKLIFDDLVAVDACNRPQPLLEGTFDLYLAGIKGKGNTKAPWYPYTQDTHGTIMYQENVIAICRELAGLSWEQVGMVLKSLKKYQENNKPLEEIFVKGLTEGNNLDEQEARTLWQNMRRYLFNKSHAVSYAMLGARMMYLKLYHPYSFYLALLNHESDKSKRQVYMADALKLAGITFLIPHVNGGVTYEKVHVGGKLYIQEGLTAIDGIGETVARAIVSERQMHGDYIGVDELLSRVPRKILSQGEKRGVYKQLENAGAVEFDSVLYLRRVRLYNSTLISTPSYGL